MAPATAARAAMTVADVTMIAPVALTIAAANAAVAAGTGTMDATAWSSPLPMPKRR